MARTAIVVGLAFALGISAGWMLRRDSGSSRILQATAVAPAQTDATYRCPMHPWNVAKGPGKCTVCGMGLVRSGGATTEMCELPAPVRLGPAVAAVIGVEIAPVVRQSFVRTLRVAGTIEVDGTRRRTLTAWADGRIDKLFVNSVGAEIRAGEPLLALFSRDLLTLQQDLLQFARAGENGASSLREQRVRMTQFGFTYHQIDELIAHREPSTTPIIMAPQSGTIVSKDVEEGQWVRTGDRLFEIADFSRLWFVFDVLAGDLEWLRVGQEVAIHTGGATFTAPIAFIAPNLNPLTRAAKARVEFEQRAGVASGAFAEGHVAVEHPSVLVVPRSAILDAGTGPVAWVERAAFSYEARALKLGRRGDALVEVLDGLAEGERVVVQGALLIDAQAQLANPGRR